MVQPLAMATNQGKKAAVVLLSGGLDSVTCLALAKSQQYDCHTISFDYGQRHRAELEAAAAIAGLFQAASHKVIQLDLASIGGSALTDNTISVPVRQPQAEAGNIPVTYVPARNTVFLSYALAVAEVLPAQDIFIGVNAVDYSGYPDCRPEYIDAFEKMANLATKAGVSGAKLTIHTPLIHKTKAEIVQLGMSLGVDYSKTISCYQADSKGAACGICDSCSLRSKGFADAGVADPTVYQSIP